MSGSNGTAYPDQGNPKTCGPVWGLDRRLFFFPPQLLRSCHNRKSLPGESTPIVARNMIAAFFFASFGNHPRPGCVFKAAKDTMED